jgi:anaerobic carbon-monoxide dehydrogenase iron sulfur subunit
MQAIVVHWERCNGCGDCLEACVRAMVEQGAHYPDVPRLHLPWKQPPVYIALCRQCDEAFCKDACISGAIHLAPDGRVILDVESCVGCWMCVAHCPFGAIAQVNNKAIKCDLCALAGECPPCVIVCPEGALEMISAEIAASRRAYRRAKRLIGYSLYPSSPVVHHP